MHGGAFRAAVLVRRYDRSMPLDFAEWWQNQWFAFLEFTALLLCARLTSTVRTRRSVRVPSPGLTRVQNWCICQVSAAARVRRSVTAAICRALFTKLWRCMGLPYQMQRQLAM